VFENAEAGHKLNKAEYEKEAPALREALLNAQFDLVERASCQVIVLLTGMRGGGRGATANLLNEWLDPRHILTYAFGKRNEIERQRPPMWRYWQVLPPKGKLGIMLGAWYQELLGALVDNRIDDGDTQRALRDIRHFETMLADEGAALVKVWLHLSREVQKQRLRALYDDPRTRWRVSARDLAQLKSYDRQRELAERVLRETSTEEARWHIVEAADECYRGVSVGRIVVEAMRARLDRPPPSPRSRRPTPAVSLADPLELVHELSLDKRLDRKDYQKQLARQQERFAALTQRKRFAKRSLVIVFEGHDAAGKGSAIRRITHALDARQYKIVPIAAPTDEERAQPYLWRFWRRLPGHGHITIFDRSWYGRVLVERVEGFCAESAWQRAYREINDFEEQILRSGTIIAKFWLHISKEEQHRRFKERQATPFKRFKITPEDWRNRRRWHAYEAAVADMIHRTSTEIAPWTVVEAEDKRYARVKVLRSLVKSLSDAL
jgi:polyphosphate:AMP phosphotransferase